ncbi:MAG TPA: murein biosynthesis integral membrane protein MurJ [Pseudolabrys sp.]|nr:murein biosynthesis integral membrane protein MurJ [Pseudolabrys sp.]
MSMTRDITTVGGGTLLSRLLAYGRDAAIAALLGAGPFSEAFFAVLQVVNFFRRLLTEGALNGAFVPIWLKLRGGEDGAANASRFARRTLVSVGVVTGIAALLIVVLAHAVVAAVAPGFDEGRKQLAALYLVIVAPYIMLTGVVAVICAALNAERRVLAATASTVVFNLVLVAVLCFLVLHRFAPFYVTIWLAAAVVATGLLQLAIAGTAWLAHGRRFARVKLRASDKDQRFFRRALPGLIAGGVPQLKLIAATAIVSSSPAAVSWLYYANRLYELPLGVASIAIAAVMVPRIAASIRTQEPAAYTAAQSRAFDVALGLALPAATGFALLASPIAAGLFEHGAFGADDTAAVAAALTAICAGLPAHVIQKVLGAISFAHEDTKSPMLTALFGLAVAVAAGLPLFQAFGFVGAAAAVAISAWCDTALLTALLARRGWLRLDRPARRRLPLIALASAIMGTVVAAGLTTADEVPVFAATAAGRLALLAILVPLGVVVYGFAIDRLGVAKIGEIMRALRASG